MVKYINITIALSALLLTAFQSRAADHQSANSQKVLVGTFIGVATYTGWLLSKSFKKTAPKPVYGGLSEPRSANNTNFMVPAIRTPRESVVTDMQGRRYKVVGGWILDVTPEQERIIS